MGVKAEEGCDTTSPLARQQRILLASELEAQKGGNRHGWSILDHQRRCFLHIFTLAGPIFLFQASFF
jgi:hypothetical protein